MVLNLEKLLMFYVFFKACEDVCWCKNVTSVSNATTQGKNHGYSTQVCMLG